MTVYKIDCNQLSGSFQTEIISIQPSQDTREYSVIPWLIQCADKAATLPNGYIKKILWDAEGGYPGHSHGFIQYSPRPFIQGYGCDGTTDENVHLIAQVLCNVLSIDYADVYAAAYPDAGEDTLDWIRGLALDQDIVTETIVPKGADRQTLALMLHDLQAINNRSVIDELLNIFGERDIEVDDWY